MCGIWLFKVQSIFIISRFSCRFKHPAKWHSVFRMLIQNEPRNWHGVDMLCLKKSKQACCFSKCSQQLNLLIQLFVVILVGFVSQSHKGI